MTPLDLSIKGAIEEFDQGAAVNPIQQAIEALKRIADPRNKHFAGDAQVVAQEALTSLRSLQTEAEGVAASVCRAVAELPDRNSPDDWPEAMLVTHDELAEAVRTAVAAALGRGAVPQITPAQAMDALKEAFVADPSYAWTWHCGVWAAAHDEGMETSAANRAAARLMSMAFDVDTSKHENFAATQAAAPSPEGTQPTQAEAPRGYAKTVIEALYENGDPVSVDAAELLKTLTAQQAEALSERESALESALAQCREAFPVPGHGAPAEDEWMAAIAEPLAVPAFVRAALATQQAVPEVPQGLLKAVRKAGFRVVLTGNGYELWSLDSPTVATQQAVQGEPVAQCTDTFGCACPKHYTATPPAPGQGERDREDADYLCKLVDAIGKDVLGVLKQYGDAQAAIGLMASRTKDAIRAARSSEGEQA